MLSNVEKLTVEAYKAEMQKYSQEEYWELLRILSSDLRSRVNPLVLATKLLQDKNLPENYREPVAKDIASLATQLQVIIDALAEYTEDKLKRQGET